MTEKEQQIAEKLLDFIQGATSSNERTQAVQDYNNFVQACRTTKELRNPNARTR